MIRHLLTIFFASIFILQGCSAKKEDKITIQEISSASPDEMSTQKVTEEQILDKSEEKNTPEISNEEPINQTLKLENDFIPINKPIMIAVMAPMSGKNDMIGNAIMEGAHLGLIKLFEKYRIPVRLTAIDTGSGIEDIEFNISKLDESQFDIILGLTSEDNEKFVEAYLTNNLHKPFILSLNPNSNCGISPQNQLKTIINSVEANEKIYVVLPSSQDKNLWANPDVTVMQYATHDPQQINDELLKIAQKIQEEIKTKNAYIIFTDGNWKLQKFISHIDNLKLKDNVQIVLASLSNLNNRMQSINEKRHKFGDIAVVTQNLTDYNNFIKEFYNTNKRRPLEISFSAYNIILQLKNGDIDIENYCKPELQLLYKHAKHNS